ncbi:MAG: pallilysin-related adhesin [Treponema sp.]|nr:pallilysin-related adhesin [Treponema sp.]
MTGKILRIIFICLLAAAIGVLAVMLKFPDLLKSQNKTEPPQSRLIIPHSVSYSQGNENQAEEMAQMELMTLKVPLEDWEIVASILNEDFNGDQMDDQIVAYRNLLETDSPIYLTYIGYDANAREYKRTWSAPTAATRPGTLSLYTQDLIGDRGTCVLLAGMNGQGEHTLTIFRKTGQNPAAGAGAADASAADDNLFEKIAEIRIDGTITVREVERSQAYQMGMAKGESYTISAYGRDNQSTNLLDQIEVTYTFNQASGLYQETQVTRIPGSQVEQRRVRELLGNANAFEDFITGLWYFVSPQGTVDNQQYIYFDPSSKEIIFYGDEAQQVFTWQNSNATRYGLYISSQNISVSTLRRSIDIELESLDSIKVKVFEDVRLNIGVNASWDGSYRKAGPPENDVAATVAQIPLMNAVYDSPMGKIYLNSDGSFTINSGSDTRQGKYAFFNLDNQQLLEFRNMEDRNTGIPVPTGVREIYLIESMSDDTTQDNAEQAADSYPKKIMVLSRVGLGASGIVNFHEGSITLSLSGTS